MHAAAYAELELPYRYVAIQVPAGEVGTALEHLRDLGYRGVNVTVPHKAEAWQWAVESDSLSRRVGAANTFDLADRRCINTDAPGFLETLRDLPIRERSAVILGAGGSAKAIVAALAEQGWRLRIYNRTASRATELASEFGAQAISDPDLSGVSLAVNTTSASLTGDGLELDWSHVKDDLVAYDLMYGKEPTPFIRSATSLGLKTVDGLDLLVAQGALAFEWWLGLPAPRLAMREALQ
jgi:shikimate dehydrogenase